MNDAKPVAETKTDDKDESAILKQAMEAYQRASDAERENRSAMRDDIRFARLGEQWDADLKKQRAQDQRPCLTINKLPPFIRQVVNDSRQNKPQIKVMPQDSKADPRTAEIMSGLIRNIETSSDADAAYDTAIDSAATCGIGYFRINLDYACDDSWDQDLVFERIANPFSVYGDPNSTAVDSSDWNVAFVTEMMDKTEFEKRFNDAEPIDWVASEYPNDWITEDQVMVAEYWTRKEVTRSITLLSNGDVMGLDEYEEQAERFQLQGIMPQGQPREVKSYEVTQRLLTGTKILETTEWAGRYIPIVPVYGEEVVLDGKRYFRSLIRDAKDAQVMYNAWRTASTELVALAPKAPFIGPEGAFETDVEKWSTANTQSHAFIEYDGPQMPQRQPFAGVPAGALQEALNAADDMKSIIGIYDAGLGARSNETSGVAIKARQREGDVSTFHFIDNLSRAVRHGGRILIDLIPKVYGAERIIRILGEEPGDAENVKLGTPEEAQASQQQQQNGVEGVERIYSLAVGKYDLTSTSGPSFTTRREEAATQMMELLRAFPAAAPVIGDILAKNLDWPGSEEIAERLQAMLQQQQGGQDGDPAAQGEQQVKMAELQIKQGESQQKAQMEQGKLQLDWFRAETDRMKVQHEMQQPERLPRAPAL